jgi:hypothetical protein
MGFTYIDVDKHFFISTLFWKLDTDIWDSFEARVQLFKYSLIWLVMMLLKRIKIANKEPEWKKRIDNYLLYYSKRIYDSWLLCALTWPHDPQIFMVLIWVMHLHYMYGISIIKECGYTGDILQLCE